MEEQGFQLGTVVGLVRRRWRLVAAVAAGVFLLSVVIAAVLRNQYMTYTTLLVEPQTISRKLVEAGLEESDLNSRLHLMTMQILSRPRLSRVIDDLGLYRELSEEKTREQVIEHMRRRIHVEPVLPELERGLSRPNSNVEINTFRLYFRDESAKTVAAVANRLANDFIDEHIRERVQVSGETADFIEGELTRLASRIQEVEGQIAQVKAESAGSLPEDLITNQRQLEQALDGLRQAQQRLAEAESDEAYYQQQALISGGSPLDSRGNATSPGQRVQVLELELGELRSRGLTDKHPDVVAITAELEQLRRRLDGEESEPTSKTPAQQNAEAEARRAGLRTQAAVQEIERLQQELTQVQERLAATPRVQERLDALEREHEHLSTSVQDFSNRRLEAAVAANMERRQKGEQFRVLETAFPPPEPVSPNRPLMLAMGLMLGLALGGALALLLEVADTSFRDARGLHQALRLPVLISVPSILLAADRARLRRRRIREAFVAAALAGIVLTGAAAGYVWVNRPGLFAGGEAEAEAAAQAPAPAPAPAEAPPES